MLQRLDDAMSRTDIADRTGVTKSQVTRWMSFENEPRGEHYAALCALDAETSPVQPPSRLSSSGQAPASSEPEQEIVPMDHVPAHLVSLVGALATLTADEVRLIRPTIDGLVETAIQCRRHLRRESGPRAVGDG